MSEVKGTIFFMDGSKMVLSWPRQANDPTMAATQVKSALENDKLTVEVDGSLIVIPMRNVKYIQVSPAPEKLPGGVVRGAQIVG
jgi:hypothetical protein